jgi:type I restriction enzyme S subunit
MASDARLADLCEAIVDCPHSTPVWTDSGVVVLRNQNIRNGRLDLSEPSYTDEAHFIDRTRRAVPTPGDLVITREAPMGKVCMIPLGLRCCLGQRMVLVRPDRKSAEPRYLLYALQSKAVQYEIGVNEGTGSTVSNLRIPLLESLPIPTRPLPEQRAIAHILGTLDDKIELNRRMSETLEAMARALFQSWFVDFDPVRAKSEGRDPGLPKHLADLFPDSFEESEVGEIPSGWEVASIGEVAYVIDCLHSRKPERRDSGFPLLQLANIRDDGLLDMSDTYLISETDYRHWISRMEALEGDCVITNVGRVGAVAQIPAGQKAALGRNMTGVRCRSDFPFPTVLIEVLLSRAMREEIGLKMDTGTILDALNVRNIPRLRFVRGARPVLSLFERLCRPLRARMEEILKESRILAALRDTLLPKLISGELLVSDAERFVERTAA